MARNGHRDDTVFTNGWKGHSRDVCGGETSKEKFEDEKQKEEDGVASFPTVLNNAVDHAGFSNESAGICRTNTLMKPMRMQGRRGEHGRQQSTRGQQLCSEAGRAGAEDH